MFYTGTQTQLTLPESYNGEQYEIAKNAFNKNENLTSIVIPKNVTAIGDSAFENCSLLKTVTFKADSALLTIGANAFKKCAIQAIAIPKSVKTIKSDAFYGCKYLKTVTFEEDINLESLEDVFYDCAFISITIPKSVKNISSYAFLGCSALETVTIEEGSTLQTIGSEAFMYCSAFETITFEECSMLQTIGKSVFENCSALKTVKMEGCSMLQTIGNGAFRQCSALKTLTIPDSVTFIDINAFSGCSNLTYTTYGGAYYLGNATNPYVVLVKAENTDLDSCTIHENTKIIYQSAFENCSYLREVEIPDGVACIGQKAFYNCGINYVSCYSSVTNIGENAFATDDGKAEVTLSYYGTQEQWDAIKKGEYGNIFNRTYYVEIYG